PARRAARAEAKDGAVTAIAARMRFARTGSGRVGVTATLLLLALILIGPLVAPHDPAAIVGIPLQRPGSGFLLGTDGLGRDVLSRVLWGGRSIIALSVVATGLAYLVGLAIGLVAGYTRSLLDPVLMRAVDVLFAFPPLLFLLILIAGAGTGVGVVVMGVAAIQAPAISRIVRTSTQVVSVRGYVEAAVSRGERAPAVVCREVLPNILAPVLVDAGLRFTYSI